jgi:hypothetical protein
MSTPERQIGKITSTFIGFEDHGILSVSLHFDYGSAAQGIGHRCFGSHDESRDPEGWRRGHEMGMDFIRRLLLACGVNQWEKLKGRTVFVTRDWTEIQKIEPLPTERGQPFDIVEWADSFKVPA